MTHSQLIKLNRWAKEVHGKIIFYFEGHTFTLVLDGVIHAEDTTGRRASWSTAFGPQSPSDVISSYKVRKIVVRIEDNELTFKSMKEFMEYASKIL